MGENAEGGGGFKGMYIDIILLFPSAINRVKNFFNRFILKNSEL